MGRVRGFIWVVVPSRKNAASRRRRGVSSVLFDPASASIFDVIRTTRSAPAPNQSQSRHTAVVD